MARRTNDAKRTLSISFFLRLQGLLGTENHEFYNCGGIPDFGFVHDGDYLVDGAMSISDLNDLLGLSIPDDDWDTVGGFLFGTLEHVPAVGEAIVHDGWRFNAAEVEGRRVRRVKVTLDPDSGQPAERR